MNNVQSDSFSIRNPEHQREALTKLMFLTSIVGIAAIAFGGGVIDGSFLIEGIGPWAHVALIGGCAVTVAAPLIGIPLINQYFRREACLLNRAVTELKERGIQVHDSVKWLPVECLNQSGRLFFSSPQNHPLSSEWESFVIEANEGSSTFHLYHSGREDGLDTTYIYRKEFPAETRIIDVIDRRNEEDPQLFIRLSVTNDSPGILNELQPLTNFFKNQRVQRNLLMTSAVIATLAGIALIAGGTLAWQEILFKATEVEFGIAVGGGALLFVGGVALAVLAIRRTERTEIDRWKRGYVKANEHEDKEGFQFKGTRRVNFVWHCNLTEDNYSFNLLKGKTQGNQITLTKPEAGTSYSLQIVKRPSGAGAIARKNKSHHAYILVQDEEEQNYVYRTPAIKTLENATCSQTHTEITLTLDHQKNEGGLSSNQIEGSSSESSEEIL